MKMQFLAALTLSLVLMDDAVVLGYQGNEIERLIRQLGSPNFAEREAASQRLGQIGAPAQEALRKAARDSSDAEIRWRAGQLLSGVKGRFVPSKDTTLKGTSKKLADKDTKIRKDAAGPLGRLGNQAKEKIPALRRALRDPDVGVRWRAGLALWRADHGLAKEALDAVRQAANELEKRLPTLTTNADVEETQALLFAALEITEGRPQRLDR